MSVTGVRSETGDQRFSDLVTNTFVGSGSLRVDDGVPIVVEYKLSKAVA